MKLKNTLRLNHLLSLTLFAFLFSCTTTNNLSNATGIKLSPLNAVQNTLKNGLGLAKTVFEDKESFLTNALIESVLPDELKSINNNLEKMGLGSLVDKEKAYIADVAAKSIKAASPLVIKSINNLTPADAVKILAGPKNSGTEYLKTTMGNNLHTSLKPLVSIELDKLGLSKLLNSSLVNKGSSLLSLASNVLGKQNNTNTTSDKINGLVTTQLVDGIFAIMEQKEVESRSNILNGIRSAIGNKNAN